MHNALILEIWPIKQDESIVSSLFCWCPAHPTQRIIRFHLSLICNNQAACQHCTRHSINICCYWHIDCACSTPTHLGVITQLHGGGRQHSEANRREPIGQRHRTTSQCSGRAKCVHVLGLFGSVGKGMELGAGSNPFSVVCSRHHNTKSNHTYALGFPQWPIPTERPLITTQKDVQDTISRRFSILESISAVTQRPTQRSLNGQLSGRSWWRTQRSPGLGGQKHFPMIFILQKSSFNSELIVLIHEEREQKLHLCLMPKESEGLIPKESEFASIIQREID